MYLLVLSLATACGRGIADTGPEEIKWSRDVCERCRMTISDRRFAVELRNSTGDPIHQFDDLGCALTWIHQKGISSTTLAEIWVRNGNGQGWIDARAAFYRPDRPSPMGYGLAAETKPGAGLLSFDEAESRVVAREHDRRHPDSDR